MKLFIFIYIITMLQSDLQAASLQTVGKELSRTWYEGGPARNLRVRCMIELRVERADEALGDRYFPNTFPPATSGTRPKTQMVPQSKWIEDVGTRGAKYRNDSEFIAAGDRPTPRGWKTSKLFNGTNSWSFDPAQKMASKYDGSTLITQLTLGYYFDMIGFPGKPVGKDRTTAGETDQPYQLDRLIPSGAYDLVGEETVDGLHCLILSRPGLDRLWLAKDRGWAIVRREWRWSLDGPLKRRIDNRDFREISPGIWIPYKGVMEIFGHPATRPNQRVGQLRATVMLAEADVAAAWFEPDFPKGTIIDDVESGERSAFGMEGQSLDSAFARAAHLGPAFRAEPWWLRLQTWVSGFLILVGVLAIRSGRRWMSRRTEVDT